MLSLERHLDDWCQEGLLDRETRDRIAAFEAGRRKPVVVVALATLGALTVGVGTISLVAANWDAIPSGVKLALDLVLLALLGVATPLTCYLGTYAPRLTWAVGVYTIVAAAFAVSLPRLHPRLDLRMVVFAGAFFGVSAIALAVGTLGARAEHQGIGALLQLLLLSIIAFGCFERDRIRLGNVVVGFVALRIVIAYFEVFGSMLSTGMAFVTGGALTLGLAYLLWRKTPRVLPSDKRKESTHAA